MFRRFKKWHYFIAIGLVFFIWLVYSKQSILQNVYLDAKLFSDRISSVTAQFNSNCDESGNCNFNGNGDNNASLEDDLYALRKSINALPLSWATGTLLPPALQLSIKPNQSIELDWSNEESSDTILANNVMFESKSGNSGLNLAIEFTSSSGPANTVLRCNNRDNFQLATSLSPNTKITFRCETVSGNTNLNDACIVRFADLSADLTGYGQCKTK